MGSTGRGMAVRPLVRRLIFLSAGLFALFSIPRLLLGSSKTIPLTLNIYSSPKTPPPSPPPTATTTKEGNANGSEQRSPQPAQARWQRDPNTSKVANQCDLWSRNDNAICCDRSNVKTDVCVMRGDVRMHSRSSTLYLLSSAINFANESIKPYPRKWENPIMSTVDPLHLVALPPGAPSVPTCDVRHDVPALVFYTGGYTGNLYHEFLDGIVPLYISSAPFEKHVVFVVVRYREWWASKYRDILSALSASPPVDFLGDGRVHCFPGAVVGLQVHEELSIDPGKMRGNRSIADFRAMLEGAYGPRVAKIDRGGKSGRAPRLTIISRNGARALENEGDVAEAGREVGFEVEVVRPGPTTDLATMYGRMNGTDVVVGAHGAALTHFLFMRPGAVLVQIVPLGLAWAAETCFGKGARRMGLRYMKYEILPHESSLCRTYPKDDPILTDPAKMSAKGWEVTKDLYLEQTIKLDIGRFRKLILVEAYEYVKSTKSLPPE